MTSAVINGCFAVLTQHQFQQAVPIETMEQQTIYWSRKKLVDYQAVSHEDYSSSLQL